GLGRGAGADRAERRPGPRAAGARARRLGRRDDLRRPRQGARRPRARALRAAVPPPHRHLDLPQAAAGRGRGRRGRHLRRRAERDLHGARPRTEGAHAGEGPGRRARHGRAAGGRVRPARGEPASEDGDQPAPGARGMRRALVALAAVVAVLAIAGVAEARPGVAIQDDKIHTIQPADMAKRVQVLAATGTRWTRVDIHWNDVAKQRPASPTDPNDPAYDWGIYDTVLKDLQARGIQAVATFYGTPAWATPGGAANAAPPPADAAAFAGALARRYNGQFTPKGAQQPLPEVRRIGVWNEPNIAQVYSPQCR